MIETRQTALVRCAIDQVWDYVKDIRRWADLMPGLQDCEIIDEDNSRWTLKVGVGALVRTVKVLVHVDEWDGPAGARFSFKLQGDPVSGGGAYAAAATGPSATEMTFYLRVEGTGPMAPMWEAMAAPLLPKFAAVFARQLAEGVETHYAASVVEAAPAPAAARADRKGWLATLFAWLAGLLRGGRRESSR